jgi:hypothetical protein
MHWKKPRKNYCFSVKSKRSESMKRNALLMTLFPVLSLIVFGMSGCQKPAAPDTNRDATSAANTNSAKVTIDTGAIELELKRIENDFPRVLKEKDTDAVDRVEADDIVVVYPDGTVGNKAQDMSDIKSGSLSADSWEVTDMKVSVLDKDAAVVSGRSIIKGGKSKAPDGKTIDISGEIRWIDTFARRNGEWKLVASISTPVLRPSAAPAASPMVKASPAGVASPVAKPSTSP